jgi:hypothetical protein
LPGEIALEVRAEAPNRVDRRAQNPEVKN